MKVKLYLCEIKGVPLVLFSLFVRHNLNIEGPRWLQTEKEKEKWPHTCPTRKMAIT